MKLEKNTTWSSGGVVWRVIPGRWLRRWLIDGPFCYSRLEAIGQWLKYVLGL